MSFVSTKHLIQYEYTLAGLKCSARKAHRIALALIDMTRRASSTWSSDDIPDLVNSPTEAQAIRNVMSALATA